MTNEEREGHQHFIKLGRQANATLDEVVALVDRKLAPYAEEVDGTMMSTGEYYTAVAVRDAMVEALNELRAKALAMKVDV